ncbi:flavodoxin I [Peribacillus frigoritolerans]|uniref:flavodoxin domain-containing protein n=1 Tax=Peribacillus frigoritolerans TaxID=450367 RepID=UPI00119A9268|nr:flavodoxin domain-containing protein [Peribacillus frigoritolerans]TWE03730.1 flavodoxin I [Peribacillus frigoritolerans]
MKVFIGYVSLSGNTEKMAISIKNRMKAVGCEVYMERLDTVEVDALKDFDLAFIGLYTWNLEDVPYEANEFYEEIDQVDFTGMKVAFFGAGDLTHSKPCAGIDILSNKMKQFGFDVYDQVLKIHHESSTYEQISKCEDFAEHALIWGSNRKKWRFLMWDRMQGSHKYQKSVFLLRRVLDDYPIKYKGRSKKRRTYTRTSEIRDF